jgi:ATP/maltotriose-dependent transcriptional regulator MalT
MADPTPELSASLGQLLSRTGYFIARSGRLLEADMLLREALQLLEASADPDRVHALTHLCSVSYQLGRYNDARRYGRDAVAFAQASNNPFYKGLALCFLHMTALATHDDAAAPLLVPPQGAHPNLCTSSRLRADALLLQIEAPVAWTIREETAVCRNIRHVWCWHLVL